MRILMLGNSFTFSNNMPAMLAEITGAEVVHHTRGGAYLLEQLNPRTKLGARTKAALENSTWDYVVLQEMSSAPVKTKDAFFRSIDQLCARIREKGAKPVLYATWPYRKGSRLMASQGISYEEMARGLSEAYHEAARRNNALIADVGQRFVELADTQQLYEKDSRHPSRTGSRVAAETIAAVILEDQKRAADNR
ncbi:MAG: SGNH/GDSL hydrolase family protein [Blautia sp.]|nr:SGNH/GDSL hydrolase family protein [Blautia sp.]